MKKNDLIFIAAVLLGSILLYFGLDAYKQNATKEKPSVVVTLDGNEYGTYPLDEDVEERIDLGGGEYNVLLIKDGVASISAASCPDQICVHHSHIKYSGEVIVCLPHQLLVEVVNGEESDIDGGTH